MKKILVSVILLTAIGIIFYSFLFNPGPTKVNVTDRNNDYITIEKDTTIAQNLCEQRNLQDKVIVLHSKYCSACKIVIPYLQEIEQEKNKNFIYLDLSKQDDIDTLKSEYKVIPRYTPTVLIGCKAFVGAYSKQEYENFIENM